jgi:hypothetical protein
LTKKNKKRVVGYAGQEPLAVDKVEAARTAHRPVVEACARAAVRSALGLRQVFLERSRLAAVLSETSKSVGEAADAVTKWQYLPKSNWFDLTEKVLELSLTDTRAAKTCLGIFCGQVGSLQAAYEVARAASPVASFQVLRGTSHALLTDSSEEVRAAWRYVLSAWGQLDPEPPRIALWQPDLDATVEEKFWFDEASRSWKYRKRDGSEASVSVEAATAHAAAR